MSLSIQEKSFVSNQEDKVNIDIPDDEKKLLSSLLELVREGHFSFVYDDFALDRKATSTFIRKNRADNNLKFRALNNNDFKNHSLLRKHMIKKYSIKECSVKIKKLPDNLIYNRLFNRNKHAIIKDCYVSVCKLRLLEENLALSKLSCITIKINMDIKEIETQYYLTKKHLWKCKICKLKTKCKSDIVRHLHFHSLLKLYKCKVCSHRFKAKCNLKKVRFNSP